MFRGLTLAEINAQLSPLVAGAWLASETSGPVTTAWVVNSHIKDLFAEKTAEEEQRKLALADLMNSKRRSEKDGSNRNGQVDAMIIMIHARARRGADKHKKGGTRLFIALAYHDYHSVSVAIS
jgi:hypothetical protein